MDVQHEHYQLEFLRRLEESYATIAGDVVEVGSGTWAIHGSIPVDGEVIVAEFETLDQAMTVLATLSSTPDVLRRGRRT